MSGAPPRHQTREFGPISLENRGGQAVPATRGIRAKQERSSLLVRTREKKSGGIKKRFRQQDIVSP